MSDENDKKKPQPRVRRNGYALIKSFSESDIATLRKLAEHTCVEMIRQVSKGTDGGANTSRTAATVVAALGMLCGYAAAFTDHLEEKTDIEALVDMGSDIYDDTYDDVRTELAELDAEDARRELPASPIASSAGTPDPDDDSYTARFTRQFGFDPYDPTYVPGSNDKN